MSQKFHIIICIKKVCDTHKPCTVSKQNKHSKKYCHKSDNFIMNVNLQISLINYIKTPFTHLTCIFYAKYSQIKYIIVM